MSPRDQHSAAPSEGGGDPAPVDAEVPAEHEVPDDLALAGLFPAASRERWRELVAGVLRKAGRDDLPEPVEDALRRTVATGVTVAPLYTASDADDLGSAAGVPGLPPFVRGALPARGAAGSPPARAPRTNGARPGTPTAAGRSPASSAV